MTTPNPRQDSDAVPHGSAGLVNQAQPSTVAAVAEAYGATCEAARDAALAKRQADEVGLFGVTNMAGGGVE